LGLTAMNDEPPATQACAARLPARGDRCAARLDPSTSASGLFAALIVSARPRYRPGSAVALSPTHVPEKLRPEGKAAGGLYRLRSTTQSSPGEARVRLTTNRKPEGIHGIGQETREALEATLDCGRLGGRRCRGLHRGDGVALHGVPRASYRGPSNSRSAGRGNNDRGLGTPRRPSGASPADDRVATAGRRRTGGLRVRRPPPRSPRTASVLLRMPQARSSVQPRLFRRRPRCGRESHLGRARHGLRDVRRHRP
jgi:hypothetical protein